MSQTKDHPPKPRAAKPTPEPATPADKAGVLRQREHIKGLTGEDPLRGGVAD